MSPETRPSKTFAPCFVVRQSDDVSDHGKGFGGWNVRLQQLSAGRFNADLTELRLDNVQLIRERTTRVILKEGEVGSGKLVFSMPLQASGPGYLNGHMLACPDPFLMDGEDLPAIRTPQYLDVATLVVDKRHVLRLLVQLGETELADLLLNRREHLGLEVDQAKLAVVRNMILDLCGTGSHAERALQFEQSRRALEEELLHAVTQPLLASRRRVLTSLTLQRRLADRACKLVLDNPDEPPTIASLCQHLGVSRRSLQDGFQSAFGLAPTQFLRIVRLNAVRRELLALPDADGSNSIGDVAARWGFWHWSRFTSYYRGLFGELPSETARRRLERGRSALNEGMLLSPDRKL